jgi:cytochrome b
MSREQIRVWDPLVRIFHWSLVATIAITWLTGEDGETLHEWAGYVALGLIAFRILWGFLGPKHARFSQFIYGPKVVVSYTRDMLKQREKRYLGHNPLGAIMVVALLATTGATGVSGWVLSEPTRLAMLPEMPSIAAPAYADSDDSYEPKGDEEALEEIHEVLANLLLILIVLHVAGVIYASMRHKEKLALAMITGNKPAPGPDDII